MVTRSSDRDNGQVEIDQTANLVAAGASKSNSPQLCQWITRLNADTKNIAQLITSAPFTPHSLLNDSFFTEVIRTPLRQEVFS